MNEDTCLLGLTISGSSSEEPASFQLSAGPWIAAVSDGIGGHVAGAEASREVASALSRCPRVTPARVIETLQRLNRQLCQRGTKAREYCGMGATVAGLGCGGRGLFAFHVGDSRIYRHEDAVLTQLTRDDSEAEELIELGLLNPANGMRPGFLHSLTQAVGGREEWEEIQPHIQPLAVTGRARFLICSDGITDMLATSDLETVMNAEASAEAAARGLFAMAMQAGGLDNISVVVLEVERLQGR